MIQKTKRFIRNYSIVILSLRICSSCIFMSNGYFLLNRGPITIRYSVKKCIGIVRVVICWNIIISGCKAMRALVLQRDFMEELINLPLECVKFIFQKGTIWKFWYLGALLVLYLLLPILSRLTKMRKVFLIDTGAIAVIIELTGNLFEISCTKIRCTDIAFVDMDFLFTSWE